MELMRMVSESLSTNTLLKDLKVDRYFSFLSFVVNEGIFPVQSQFALFEELFATQPIHQIEGLFCFLEEEVYAKYDDAQEKPILRICNSLLKRLSATHNTAFRGRVQRLLSAALPLTHKSGKAYHLITTYANSRL